MVLETATSSHMCQPCEEDVSEMTKLMSDGKRNYFCNQPHIALDCFVELCEKLAKWYGQESEKCVEAYLFYGKTLLDIARLENGVLGHAIKETPVFGSKADTDDGEEIEKECNTEDEDAIKPDDIRTHVERAMREDNLYNVSTDEQTEEEEDITTEEEDDEVGGDEKEESGITSTSTDNRSHEDATTTNTTEESATAIPDESTTTAEEQAEMDIDVGKECEGSDTEDTYDISNLELSWEMLELTTVICKRQLHEEGHDHKAVKSTLAEAKHGLAQISLEMERYEDATNDFMECLDLYKEVVEDKNSRVIAEGHYNIALALSFDKKYLEAIEAFERAVAILEARVLDLESKVKDTEAKKDKDLIEVGEWRKEIVELNDLIVLDMMSKIEDSHESNKLLDDSINTVKAAASEIFSGTKNEFDAGFSEGFDTPLSTEGQLVHDCSDSIRSLKRKSDDEPTEICDNEPKQRKSEELSEE